MTPRTWGCVETIQLYSVSSRSEVDGQIIPSKFGIYGENAGRKSRKSALFGEANGNDIRTKELKSKVSELNLLKLEIQEAKYINDVTVEETEE